MKYLKKKFTHVFKNVEVTKIYYILWKMNGYACTLFNQRIIDPTGTEIRQIFSGIFLIAEFFEELFTSS